MEAIKRDIDLIQETFAYVKTWSERVIKNSTQVTSHLETTGAIHYCLTAIERDMLRAEEGVFDGQWNIDSRVQERLKSIMLYAMLGIVFQGRIDTTNLDEGEREN